VFAQVLVLAVQVKRPAENGSSRLIRVWTVSAITPLEKAITSSGRWVRSVWGNYLYLRGVREQNRTLRNDIERLRIEQVRLSEDANQGRRLQALLAFKQQFISETVAAQVIGSSGSDQSRVLYIDKGANSGLKPDMAVITPDGIVGKALRVFPSSAQVLLISDASSGVGAILENTRLQGILQGTASGELMLRYIMADETVKPGERVLASGGDRVFPKGFPIGTVSQVNPGSDLFLNIRVKPAANLDRLEEVLIITRMAETAAQPAQAAAPVRAADILAQRLPGVPPKPAAETKQGGVTGVKPPSPPALSQPAPTQSGPQTLGPPTSPGAVKPGAATSPAGEQNSGTNRNGGKPQNGPSATKPQEAGAEAAQSSNPPSQTVPASQSPKPAEDLPR
jgi:rod shape-determining protein MreC